MADSIAEAAKEIRRGRYPAAGVWLPPPTWGVIFAIVAAWVGEKVDEDDWDRGHSRQDWLFILRVLHRAMQEADPTWDGNVTHAREWIEQLASRMGVVEEHHPELVEGLVVRTARRWLI